MRILISAMVALTAWQGSAALAAENPVARWTGFYAGVNGGAGWSDRSAQWYSGDGNPGVVFLKLAFLGAVFGPDVPHYQRPGAMGVFGGVQAGYNQQWGQFLAGLEADIQASGIKGRKSTTGVLDPTLSVTVRSEQKLDWFGTVRGRAGVLLWDQRVLAYATGGLAFGHTGLSGEGSASSGLILGVNPFLICPVAIANATCVSGSRSKTASGGTAGGGIEMMLAGNVRFKAEYLHIDLGNESFRLVPVPPATGNALINLRFKNAFDLVRVGLNFGF